MNQIEHVIVLMLENRSFDQMLGCFQKFRPVNGIPPDNPYQNPSPDGPVFQQPNADPALKLKPDPKHETDHVLRQIEGGNTGFVRDYAKTYDHFPHHTGRKQWQRIMSYYAHDRLPALHTLADHFTICDRWFSSVPGPTWTNRLFAHSGTSQGWVKMPSLNPPGLHLHPYDQETIFDLIDEKPDVTWRIYWDDFALSLLLEKLRNLDRIREHFREFGANWETDIAGPASEFPNYVFIEPNYLLNGQNDDHPPCRTARGEELIARVYNALRANEELWTSSLLVVLFDEHGGFYDHEPPTAASPPDDLREEYDFKLYGVRVPALLVSPWVAAGVCKTEMDHTSLLRFLIKRFGLADDRLGRRVAEAKTFEGEFLGSIRPDTPIEISGAGILEISAADAAEPDEPEELSDLQKSIIELSRKVEEELTPSPYVIEAVEDAALPPRARCEVAKERMRRVAGVAAVAST